MSTRMKPKTSESSKKDQVIESLTETNNVLEKKLKETEEALATFEAEKTTVVVEVTELKNKNEELTSEAQALEAVKASLALRVAKLDEELKMA